MKLVQLRPLDDGTLAREGGLFADIAIALTGGGTITGSIDRPAITPACRSRRTGSRPNKRPVCVVT
jgi:hypothetical protein